MTVAREAAAPRAVAAHHQPIAVMLDFMDPQRAGWRPRHLRQLARFDEARGMAPLKDHRRRIGQRATGSTAPVKGGKMGADTRTSVRRGPHKSHMLSKWMLAKLFW